MNASGTPIEHTNARHVTVVAHASLPPTRHHAKLARGDGRPRAHHILWRGHGARTWLNADKLCARAPHSRLFMIMCVNTCLVARAMLTWLGGYRPPAWTTSQAQLAGPMVACVNHTKNVCDARALGGRFCSVGGMPKHAMRVRSTFERESSCAQDIRYAVLQRQSFMRLGAHRNHLTTVVIIRTIPIYTPSQYARCRAIA